MLIEVLSLEVCSLSLAPTKKRLNLKLHPTTLYSFRLAAVKLDLSFTGEATTLGLSIEKDGSGVGE